MVPLGVSSATAVLVGQELGRKRPLEAAAYGWKGLKIGVGFMAFTAVFFIIFSKPLIGLYTADTEVHAIARQILWIVALFQISDGAQTVAAGALRGMADTRTSMWANLLGHWLIGLPLGIFLGFKQMWGLTGIWTGLAAGLTVVAGILCIRWQLKTGHSR
jgi:MATE family multidrug resistance protein